MGKTKDPSDIFRDLPRSNIAVVTDCEIATGIGKKYRGKWVFVTNSGKSKESKKSSLAFCKRQGYKKCVIHRIAYTAIGKRDPKMVAVYGKI